VVVDRPRVAIVDFLPGRLAGLREPVKIKDAGCGKGKGYLNILHCECGYGRGWGRGWEKGEDDAVVGVGVGVGEDKQQWLHRCVRCRLDEEDPASNPFAVAVAVHSVLAAEAATIWGLGGVWVAVWLKELYGCWSGIGGGGGEG